MSDGAHRILLLDDEPDFRQAVVDLLNRQGFAAFGAADTTSAREILAREAIDLVLVDLILEREDGLDFARELFDATGIPVIIVSGRGDEIDRIVCLELGAVDYIAKPFHNRELIARIKIALRHGAGPGRGRSAEDVQTYRFGGWRFVPAEQRLAHTEGNEVRLTGYEIQVLRALVDRPNQLLSRAQIKSMATNRVGEDDDRSVDVVISKLRNKLGDDASAPRFIRTIRNTGYIFIATVHTQRDSGTARVSGAAGH